MDNKEYYLKKNAFFINPFSLYAISWIIVIIIYNLEWSYLYPKLKLDLLLFLIITVCISIYYSRTKYKSFRLRSFDYNNKYFTIIKRYCIILYILLIIEFIICGIPFLAYGIHAGEDDTLYMNWGLPVIKVIVINGFSVLFLFTISVYFLSNKNKPKLLFYIFLSILPPIICMQRGIALNMIVGAFCIYMMQTRNLKRSLLITLLLGITVLYGFGVIGQKRMNGKEDLILEIGQPTNKFDKSYIPMEFFWSYLYISSPLANLQSEINQIKKIKNSDTGFLSFIGLNIIPETISKHFYKNPDLSEYRITSALTVGSTYLLPYYQLGWLGLWLMFFYIILFIKLCMRIIKRDSPFHPVLVAVLCEVSFFGIFDNMTAYAAMFPQLILIYLGSKYLFR